MRPRVGLAPGHEFSVPREERFDHLIEHVLGRFGEERGVLKRSVPHWLRLPDLRPLVVGFEEAQPRHGGSGALYIRLRRSREL